MQVRQKQVDLCGEFGKHSRKWGKSKVGKLCPVGNRVKSTTLADIAHGATKSDDMSHRHHYCKSCTPLGANNSNSVERCNLCLDMSHRLSWATFHMGG